MKIEENNTFLKKLIELGIKSNSINYYDYSITITNDKPIIVNKFLIKLTKLKHSNLIDFYTYKMEYSNKISIRIAINNIGETWQSPLHHNRKHTIIKLNSKDHVTLEYFKQKLYKSMKKILLERKNGYIHKCIETYKSIINDISEDDILINHKRECAVYVARYVISKYHIKSLT